MNKYYVYVLIDRAFLVEGEDGSQSERHEHQWMRWGSNAATPQSAGREAVSHLTLQLVQGAKISFVNVVKATAIHSFKPKRPREWTVDKCGLDGEALRDG